MIRLIAVPCVLLLVASTAWADPHETLLTTAIKGEAARYASAATRETVRAGDSIQVVAATQAPSRRSPRCCNLKGAIIGAAIGVALGNLLTANACDVEDCTSTYVKVSVIFGGIGATIGALAK